MSIGFSLSFSGSFQKTWKKALDYQLKKRLSFENIQLDAQLQETLHLNAAAQEVDRDQNEGHQDS